MTHCIIAKFVSSVDAEQKSRIAGEVRELFSGLLSMPGFHEVKVFRNCVERPNRYDLMITVGMDANALKDYDASEPHRLWKLRYGSLLESKAIFDYEPGEAENA